ncbi:MAG: tripartite tricarboxylate transporter TctB family protein [Paracoccaceae bacterium]
MKLDDLALGILMLAVGAAIYASSLRFSAIPGQAYGAETMPLAVAWLGLGLGAFLCGRALLAGARRPEVRLADWARERRAVLGAALTLGLVLAYILLADRLGFVPTAFAIMLALMLALRTPVPTAVIVSAIAAVVIQQAFGRLLLVPLPRGPLAALFW